MKVGIITFHRAINCGAALQTFALYSAFKRKEIACEIIDYVNEKIENRYSLKPLQERKNVRDFIKYFVVDRERNDTRNEFFAFYEKYVSMSKLYDIHTINDCDYSMIITGSDQVWNSNHTGIDPSYYLNFCKNAKKISYAASFGKDVLNKRDESFLLEYLNDFDYISVREDSAKNIIKSYLKLDVVVAPDPVFLHDKLFWINTFSLPESHTKYIFYYGVVYNEQLISYVEHLSKEKHLRVFVLSNSFKAPNNSKKIKRYNPISFLKMIYGAEYIVTDSFHATAFSIIFNKKFIVGMNVGENAPLNTRIRNILSVFRLEDRVYKTGVDIDEEINYPEINSILLNYQTRGNAVIDDIVNIGVKNE